MLTLHSARTASPAYQASSSWDYVIYPRSRPDVDVINATQDIDSNGSVFTATSGLQAVIPDFPAGIVAAGKQWSIVARVLFSSVGLNGIVAHRWGDGWTLCVYLNKLDFFTSNLGGFVTGTHPDVSAGAWHNVGITSNGDGSGFLSLDGISYPISGLNNVVANTGVTQNLELMTWDNGNYVQSGSKLALAAVSGFGLSSNELSEITKNPWQIFAPQKRIIYFDVGVGGGGTSYTLLGSAGAFTLTGNSATLTHDAGSASYSIFGSAGAYELIGNTATLTHDAGGVSYSLSGSAGTFTLNGNAAAFKVDYVLQGQVGEYNVLGLPATLSYSPGSSTQNYALSGSNGSYLITGNAAAFSFSGEVSRPVVFIKRNVENDPDKVRKIIYQYFDEYEFLHGALSDKNTIFNAAFMMLEGNESRAQIKNIVNEEIKKHFERIAEYEDEEALLMFM